MLLGITWKTYDHGFIYENRYNFFYTKTKQKTALVLGSWKKSTKDCVSSYGIV